MKCISLASVDLDYMQTYTTGCAYSVQIMYSHLIKLNMIMILFWLVALSLVMIYFLQILFITLLGQISKRLIIKPNLILIKTFTLNKICSIVIPAVITQKIHLVKNWNLVPVIFHSVFHYAISIYTVLMQTSRIVKTIFNFYPLISLLLPSLKHGLMVLLVIYIP